MADLTSEDDIASFNDSDQFDDDSLSIYSWFSEHDSVSAITWNGWKKNSSAQTGVHSSSSSSADVSLVDLCAKAVAEHFPFQAVEEHHPPVPEDIQLKIAYWSFPRKENNIQMYSCIAHGTLDEFHLAELTLRWKNVKNVIQIGFHLTGMVVGDKFKDEHSIAVTFDRCQIINCTCSCQATSKWCSHIIALCLFRIRHPDLVSFHAPISESLSRLKRDQLQKFAQYLINELPPKVLPVAQGLLNQILNDPYSKINTLSGAPDPTAGAGYNDEPAWNLDGETLRDKIRKVIGRLCGLSPVAFVDLNPCFFTSSAPTLSDEWGNLLRPLISHEPEAIWNLFDIIKNLLKAQDGNSLQILQIVTEELLNFPQLSLWWFIASTEVDSNCFVGNSAGAMQQNHATANAISAGYARNTVARLFDEIVELWKAVMIVPCVVSTDKEKVIDILESWHEMALEKTRKGFAGREQKFSDAVGKFNGFKPAIEAGRKNWRMFLIHVGVDPDFLDGLRKCSSNSSCMLLPNSSVQDLPMEDYLKDLCNCLNSFHTLGFSSVARSLAVELAGKLLSKLASNQNDLSIAIKSADVCRVLVDSVEHQRLSFQLGLQGLSIPRKPAKTKLQEVKLANCEMKLRSALKMMAIGHEELQLIRSSIKTVRALANLRDPHCRPFLFVIYVLEVFSGATVQSRILTKMKNRFIENCAPSNEDMQFAYNFALKSLGWTCSASDQSHSMLCESFRHFRNDLAETLIWHFRNSKNELQEVLAGLLNLECYIPSLLTMKTMRKNPCCTSAEGSEIQAKEAEKRRLSSGEAQQSKNGSRVEEVDSQELVPEAEDWDAEITGANNVCQRASRVSSEKELTLKSSRQLELSAPIELDEAITGCVTDKSFPNNKCKLGNIEPEASEIEGENVDVGSNDCHIDPTADLERREDVRRTLEVACSANDTSEDMGVHLDIPMNNKGYPYEPTLVDEKGKDCERADPLNKDGEHFLLCGSIDGRNTWDPAISWAENCESKCTSDLYKRVTHRGHEVSSNNDYFPVEIRRGIEKTRLECDSHALFELAKEVLSKSLDQIDDHDSHIFVTRPHKQLQLTAFEIGIFSLRLHNFISPKWLSRTYSSHVSWIADKCIDIGCAAIQKLNDSWEDVLTPSEVIDISARASRSRDHNLQHAAAELAVSCLPHSHMLNPGEIQQAINLCKEQDLELLERACASVEASSRNGGILPEILFCVARQWQHIHEMLITDSNHKSKSVKPSNMEKQYTDRPAIGKMEPTSSNMRPFHQKINKSNLLMGHPVNVLSPNIARDTSDVKFRPRQRAHDIDEQPQLQHNNPPAVFQDFSRGAILTAEQYVQQQMHRMAEEMLKRNHAYEQISSRMKSPGHASPLSRSHLHCPRPLIPPMLAKVESPMNVFDKSSKEGDSEISIQLQTAFRVGIKALEALARRGIDEERSDMKYAPSPPCSDDIRWLCALTASLGPPYLRKFCKTVTSSVSSPFVLHDLALEAARHFAMYNPAQLASFLRSPAVSPIVSKCLTMYSEVVRRDLLLVNQNSYSDFVELLRKARSAFCMAPGGMIRFNELLEMIRKSCARKGDLWQHIMNGLSRA